MTGKITPPRAVTGFFYVGADVALQTIVAPAANTKGIVVTAAHAFPRNDGTRSRVMAKTSAPASVTDTSALTLAHSILLLNGAGQFFGGIALPIVLPPGVGLYAQKDDVNVAGGFSCDYELLA